jgi:small subunit ribosomal protein S9
MGVIHKIGRRKPLARVYVSEGTGVITVNKKEFATSLQLLYSTK